MRLLSTILAVGALVFAVRAEGQPTGLFSCATGGGSIPTCEPVVTGHFIDGVCGRQYTNYSGRVEWTPLLNNGPITVEINARATLFNRFPIYISVVPLEGIPPGFCPNAPGYILGVARGGLDCDPWETIGPLDIDRSIPRGTTYAFQLSFFGNIGTTQESPAINCVRVTSNASSAVAGVSWSQAKRLYK